MDVMKSLKYSLILACSITLCSCFSGPATVERVIDNPTSNEIVIAIDGKELAIPANSKTTYTFEYGKHNLTYNNESLDFIVKPSKYSGDGFINPTQSNYMLHTFIYATNNTSDEAFDKIYKETINKISIILNGEEGELELPVIVVNDVFIEGELNRWDYSIDQEIPEEITENINENQAFQTRKTKIYREKEYINLLQNDYFNSLEGEESKVEISFPNKTIKLAEITKYAFPKINLEEIKCDEGKKYLTKTLENWQKFFTLTDNDFASTYEDLSGEEGKEALIRSLELCPKKIDPENTYFPAYKQLVDFINDTRYIPLILLNKI